MGEITSDTVKRDIDVMLWSMRLYDIRRFKKHRFWEAESLDAEYAHRIEPDPRLESVAEHSWHVADTILLLADNFPSINLERCLRMAILHDKMEIYIGDRNPVGRDGTGEKTHAFNKAERLRKNFSEGKAIEKYLAKLRPSIRSVVGRDLYEMLEGSTEEACFVKAVDKLQALAYVFIKKNGIFKNRHLIFTLRYSEKAVEYYPGLKQHYKELRYRVLSMVAIRRNTKIEDVTVMVESEKMPLQMSLFSS